MLQSHHHSMSHLAQVSREPYRCSFGTMRAAGFRIAQGGRPGDGYAPYPCVIVDPSHMVESIEKMFQLAYVGGTTFKLS